MLLPANRQNNERTKTPRKRVSLLPFVLPLKRCHRNSLPSSCIVQTRLLFFFSFQILSVRRFFFLKPLKKAPSRVMERVESFESCVPLRKKTNERKDLPERLRNNNNNNNIMRRRRRRQRRRRHEHHHQQKRRNAKRDRRRLLLPKRRRRRKQREKKKKKMVTVQLLRRRRNERL